MNLTELLTQPEGKNLEFKRDLSSPDGLLRTIVAFANTAGGTLLVGVEDRTRKVRGLKDVLLDSAEIHSLPAQAIEEAIAFVRKYLAREAVIGEVRRHDRWTLPAAALREAIINAVVHADYSQRGAPLRLALFDDRLEIENPGLLPFGLTMEDLWQGISRLRNRVTLSVLPRQTAMLDERDRQIVELLKTGSGFSTQQIADQLELSTRATRARLRALVERGAIAEIASSPQDPRKQYVARQPRNDEQR